jgi:iron complex transport system substrate-binding protein
MSACGGGSDPVTAAARGDQGAAAPSRRAAAAGLAALLGASCAASAGVAAGGGAATQPDPPRRIVSLTPCLDAILVHVAERSRIAALSHYTHEPESSSLGPIGSTFPFTYGTAEEIVALRPDLVLSGPYIPAATRGALSRLGVRTAMFNAPDTIAENIDQIAAVAAAVGRPELGAALIARIRQALALAAPAPGERRISALVYQAGGFAAAKGALMDDLLSHAGFDNAAPRYGLVRTGYVPLERLVADPPEVLLAGAGRPEAPTWADRVLRHPALARARGRMHRAAFPQRLTNCGGPVLIEAAATLARIRRDVLAGRA